MKLPPTDPELGIPNMMPLIDIIFLLLIFFLMASRFEQEERKERELPVQLPEVAEAQPLTTQDLVINITPEGHYVVGKQQYSEVQLAALLEQTHQKNPHQAVLIWGDGRVPWKLGVRVMGLCNKAKISKYSVAALQE